MGIVSTKFCRGCRRTLSTSVYFGTRGHHLKGHRVLRYRCRDCEAKQVYDWKHSNRDRAKEISRSSCLSIRYKLTVKQYEKCLKEQNGGCKICKSPPGDTRLDVDHNHTTGKFRGLLCRKCNVALGLLKERTDLVMKAAEYMASEGEI